MYIRLLVMNLLKHMEDFEPDLYVAPRYLVA